MRVVLDTNVVVSGLLTPGHTCAEVLDQMRAGAFIVCLNGAILAEYEEVLRRPELSLPVGAVEDFLDFVRHRAERVDAPLLATRLPDASDLPFLEVAFAAGAALVTGNTRHFPAAVVQGLRALSPSQFQDLLRRGE